MSAHFVDPRLQALPSSLLVVGLTGGIGCGKSTVANIFAQKKIALVDADVIAHQLTSSAGIVMPLIRAAFGDGMLTAEGSLNRRMMRSRIFQNPSEKLRLEAILHPAIRDEVNRQISLAKTSPTRASSAFRMHYIILVAPLLFESLWYRQTVTHTLAVDCPQAMQITRVMQRAIETNKKSNETGGEIPTDEISAKEVCRMIAAQIPRALRLQLADDVIFNDKLAIDLEARVACLHERYLALAETCSSSPCQIK